MSTISVELASGVAIEASTMELSLAGFEAVSLSTAGDSLAADSASATSADARTAARRRWRHCWAGPPRGKRLEKVGATSTSAV